MPPIAAALHREQPDLSLYIREGIPEEQALELSRGELDKIIQRNASNVVPARSAAEPSRPDHRPIGYRNGDDDNLYRQGKRKKSFLSELFD